MQSELDGFQKQVEALISGTTREPHWDPVEAQRYMISVGDRRQKFEAIANRLSREVICPRVRIVAKFFSNAKPLFEDSMDRCTCIFGYCERFPASSRVTFTLEHDVRYEKVYLCYEASMSPSFIKLNEHDKATMPLDKVDDQKIGQWVQDRLVEFLDDYLRIDRGLDDFEDETATDPVCGMRLSRNHAAAIATYIGREYFFCSQDCHDRFVREPTAYVKVELD
jgi:YHS domain-containing protein